VGGTRRGWIAARPAYDPAVEPHPWAPHPWALSLRLFLYAALQLGGLVLHLHLTTRSGEARTWLAEGGALEWTHVSSLSAALLFTLLARGPLRAFLACLLLAALARELDEVVQLHLGRLAHRVVMAVCLAAAAWIALKPGNRFPEHARAFIGTPAFWLMAFGTIAVTLQALVLGQTSMWTVTSAPGYDRINKRFVEEGMEASGFLWILFGAFEVWLAARRGPEPTPR